MVVCVRLPFFATAVERRDDNALQQQPLVLGHQQKEAVYSMSQEAAADGVRLDVSLREARLRSPESEFLPSALTYYERTAHEVAGWLLDFTQQVEPQPTRPAIVYYVDGTFSTENHTIAYAQEIGRTLRNQTALVPTVGIAANKFTAYVAAKSVRVGRLLPVSAESTTDFLSTVPLHMLTLPEQLRQRFHLLGLQTLGDLATLPSSAIMQQFGQAGQTLFALASGIDRRPIRHYPLEQKETWSYAVDDPIRNLLPIQNLLSEGAQQLVAQLKQNNLSARGLTLHLMLENGDRLTMREQFSQPTQRLRHIQRALLTLVERNRPASGVVDLGIVLSYLAPILQKQLSLFEAPVPDETIEDTLLNLSDRHGKRFFQVEAFRPNSRFPDRRYRITPHAAILG